jgi:hypothetical protein
MKPSSFQVQPCVVHIFWCVPDSSQSPGVPESSTMDMQHFFVHIQSFKANEWKLSSIPAHASCSQHGTSAECHVFRVELCMQRSENGPFSITKHESCWATPSIRWTLSYAFRARNELLNKAKLWKATGANPGRSWTSPAKCSFLSFMFFPQNLQPVEVLSNWRK